MVRKGSELESNIVSVERIREYSEIATEVFKQAVFWWVISLMVFVFVGLGYEIRMIEQGL